ncbi:MAG: amidohydrolase family protein [Chloroflexi bacterium]|nr:amidohydrolase family protein [Chloroflexota bacterium]
MLIVDSHVHTSQYWAEPIQILLCEMDANAVEKAVLVQLMYCYDNEYLLDCMRRYPGRFAACVVVDVEQESAPAQLEDCVRRGASGLRMKLTAGAPDSLQLAVWRKAEELGLAVSVFGTKEQFASDEFRRIVETFPNLRFVIEHYGRHGQSATDEPPPYPVYRRVLSLADYPNTYMKLGGLSEVCGKPMPFGQPTLFRTFHPSSGWLSRRSGHGA